MKVTVIIEKDDGTSKKYTGNYFMGGLMQISKEKCSGDFFYFVPEENDKLQPTYRDSIIMFNSLRLCCKEAYEDNPGLRFLTFLERFKKDGKKFDDESEVKTEVDSCKNN